MCKPATGVLYSVRPRPLPFPDSGIIVRLPPKKPLRDLTGGFLLHIQFSYLIILIVTLAQENFKFP